MKRWFSLLALLALVAIVAAAASLMMQRVGKRPAQQSYDDAHTWIHKHLALTPEQEQRLAPIEQRYDEQKKNYGELIRLANMELAQAILTDKDDSPRVKDAVEKIHEAQGQLQKATLAHVFEMKSVLNEQQYDKLLDLTANALFEVNHEANQAQ